MAENLEIEEKNLFDDIKSNQKYIDFVYDGIVNYDVYSKADVKILYILKESINTDGSVHIHGENLKNFLISGGEGKINARSEEGVTRDVEAIEAAYQGKLLTYEELNGINISRRKRALSKVAWFNLSKESNQTSTNSTNETFRTEEIENNANIYKKIFELYHPDIIVCGGTFSEFCLIYPELVSKENQQGYAKLNIDGKLTPVLKLHHPSYGKKKLMYKQRTDAIKKIYKINRIS